MSGRNYGYQYETSPRKLNPEYDEFVRRMPRKDKAKKVTNKKVAKNTTNKRIDDRAYAKKEKKAKITIGIQTVIIFALLIGSLALGAQNDKAFSEIQKLNKQYIHE